MKFSRIQNPAYNMIRHHDLEFIFENLDGIRDEVNLDDFEHLRMETDIIFEIKKETHSEDKLLFSVNLLRKIHCSDIEMYHNGLCEDYGCIKYVGDELTNVEKHNIYKVMSSLIIDFVYINDFYDTEDDNSDDNSDDTEDDNSDDPIR